MSSGDEKKQTSEAEDQASAAEETVQACEKKKSGLKKFFKITGWIFGILLLLLLLLFFCRDFIIENAVRHVGSLVTGTEVQIASFDSSLKGTVELKNIRVANPKGYQKPFAFEIDRIYIKILPETLSSDEPIVETVEVSGVRIDMEIKNSEKNNLKDIQTNIEKFANTGSDAKEEKKTQAEEPASNENAPAPLIKKIALTSMSLSLSSSTLNSSVPVPLAPIYLNDLGGKGQPIQETLFKIFSTLMNAVNRVGGTLIGGVEAVSKAGKNVGTGIVKGADAVGNVGKNVGAGVVDGVKSIGDGIGGMFRKK